MTRDRILSEELDSIKKKMVRYYQPEKIIIFGSYASGNIKQTSDLDIAIIKKTSARFLDRLKEVALLTRPKIGVDFLVYTPEEFKKMKEQENHFIKEIEKGKVIYDENK